jgi:hypothetical protein
MADGYDDVSFPSWAFVIQSSLGYGPLQYNPALTVRWTGFANPATGMNKFSGPLREALNLTGIDYEPSSTVLGAPGANYTSNQLGTLGSDALAESYANQGYAVSQNVSIFDGAREIDVVAYRGGFLGGQMIYGESKVGYKSLNSDYWRSGSPSCQLLADARAFDLNRLARFGGKALGVAGLAYDAISTGTTAYGQLEAGNTSGAALTGAEFGGRLNGMAAGGWAGAVLGGAIGTAVPGIGNLVGAGVGGFVGGIVGAIGGQAAVDRIASALTGGGVAAAQARASMVTVPQVSVGPTMTITDPTAFRWGSFDGPVSPGTYAFTNATIQGYNGDQGAGAGSGIPSSSIQRFSIRRLLIFSQMVPQGQVTRRQSGLT